MALVVETGSGSSTAESYISVADADTYFDSKRGPASTYAADWDAVATTEAIKEACLRWATRLIDKGWVWDGQKSTTTQALKWPRSYVLDDEGEEIDGDVIPADLKYAVAELARALLVDPERVEDQEVGLSSLGVGSIQLVFDKFDRAGALPRPVKDLLSSFGSPRRGGGRETARA